MINYDMYMMYLLLSLKTKKQTLILLVYIVFILNILQHQLYSFKLHLLKLMFKVMDQLTINIHNMMLVLISIKIL